MKVLAGFLLFAVYFHSW